MPARQPDVKLEERREQVEEWLEKNDTNVDEDAYFVGESVLHRLMAAEALCQEAKRFADGPGDMASLWDAVARWEATL